MTARLTLLFSLALHAGAVASQDSKAAPPNAAAPIVTQAVPYSHGDVALEGFLAAPKNASGRGPAVLIVHEWWGCNEFARAQTRRLAELGYVAMAIDMYGKGVVTDDPAKAREYSSRFKDKPDLMRGRAEAGLTALAADPRVDPKRIVAMGYCFGGTTVLQMAFAGQAVAGVVSFHGGLPIPTEADLPRIHTRILVLHGAEDSLIPDEVVHSLQAGLRKSGCDWQMIYYGRAKHSFTNPNSDQLKMKGVGYDAAADSRSWEALRTFLNETIPLSR